MKGLIFTIDVLSSVGHYLERADAIQAIITRGDITMDRPPLPNAITIPEACVRWGVSRNTLIRRIEEGKLKAYKPGQNILIDVDEGDSWWRTSGEKLVKNNAGSRRKRRLA